MVASQRLPSRDDLRLLGSEIVLLNAEFAASSGGRSGGGGGGGRVVAAAAIAISATAAQHLFGVEPGKLLLDLEAENADDVDALLFVHLTRRTGGEIRHEGDDS